MLKNNIIITEFLDEYAVIVRQFESQAYIDLMLKTHQKIEYNDAYYYIPRELKLYNNVDNMVLSMLTFITI